MFVEKNNNYSEEAISGACTEIFTESDKANMYYIAGSCVTFLLTHKNICENCKKFLLNVESCHAKEATLTKCLDLRGLKNISSITYKMFQHTESVIQNNMTDLLQKVISFKTIITYVKDKYDSLFPQCVVISCIIYLNTIQLYEI